MKSYKSRKKSTKIYQYLTGKSQFAHSNRDAHHMVSRITKPEWMGITLWNLQGTTMDPILVANLPSLPLSGSLKIREIMWWAAQIC